MLFLVRSWYTKSFAFVVNMRSFAFGSFVALLFNCLFLFFHMKFVGSVNMVALI